MLGWLHTDRGLDGRPRDFYVRQLWDWKFSARLRICARRGTGRARAFVQLPRVVISVVAAALLTIGVDRVRPGRPLGARPGGSVDGTPEMSTLGADFAGRNTEPATFN
jgi:hypothetical protein